MVENNSIEVQWPTSVKHTKKHSKRKPIFLNTHTFAETQTSILKHVPKSRNTNQVPKT